MTPPIRAWILTAFALLLAWSSPAQAQDFDPSRVSLTMEIFETRVSFPPPSWQRTPTGKGEHEFNRRQQGPVFVFEQIPKGQTFQDWSKMQAVLGVFGAAGQNLSFAEFVSRSIGQFVTVCGRDNFTHNELASDATAVTVVIYCENSPNAPAERNLGYGPGVGEIALMTFRRHASTYLKIYHEWRGSSFDVDDPQTWPVSERTLDEMIQRYQLIRVAPKSN